MVTLDRKKMVVGVLVLGGALFFLCGRFEGETRRVRRQVDRFCERVSKDGDENNLALALRAQEVSALFAPSVYVETQVGRLKGQLARSDIKTQAAMIRSQFRRLVFSVRGSEITMGEDGIAVVTGTAVLKGTLMGGEAVSEAREVVLKLRKEEGTWCFFDCREVTVLRK
jgi:hypothetical protein